MSKYAPIKNLKDLIQSFSDEQKCRDFLVQQRWNGCPECPYCGSGKYYVIENGKRFKCGNKECYKKYSVTVGTIFHASNIPLTTWFPAVYLITAHKKGISSIQLAKDLGITQKTAWFMLHRIRESLADKSGFLLKNVVEVDEVYLGSKFKNLSNSKRAALREEFGDSAHNQTKIMVIGMLERDGNLKLVVSGKPDTKHQIPLIMKDNIDKSAFLMTDGEGTYTTVKDHFKGHDSVNHNGREYVRGDVYTNSIEGAFSLLKRSIVGIYHHLSPKHCFRYCRETEYRYNTRKMADGERFEMSLGNISGKLPYKELIKKTDLSAHLLISPAVPEPNIILNPKIKGRPVCQIKNGEIIGEYPSIIAASKATGIGEAAISRVVRGERKSTHGFVWKYI
ncbi:MAG: IS1595 family transposase [Ginsengibacter sp.]